MPPWQYAALATGEPVKVFTTPHAMAMWADYARILHHVETAEPPKRTTETFG